MNKQIVIDFADILWDLTYAKQNLWK